MGHEKDTSKASYGLRQSSTKDFMDVGEFQASLGYIWKSCVEKEKGGAFTVSQSPRRG